MSTNAIKMSEKEWLALKTQHPDLARLETPVPDTTPEAIPPEDTRLPQNPLSVAHVVTDTSRPARVSTGTPGATRGLVWAITASVLLNVVMLLLLIALHVRLGQVATTQWQQTTTLYTIENATRDTCTLDAPYATTPATPHLPRTRSLPTLGN